jgi:hypothetical protein
VGVTAVLPYCLIRHDASEQLPHSYSTTACLLLLPCFGRYGAVIYACEVVGMTAVLPYCLIRHDAIEQLPHS